MSVPGEFVAGDVLAASEMNALPGGVLGYTEVTANQGPITTEADLTGLTATVTVPAGRRVKITVQGHVAASIDGIGIIRVKESTTDLNAVQVPSGGGVTGLFYQAVAIVAPSSGSHTYKASLALAAGTGTVTHEASSARIAFILVEDLGEV